ncbi:MAG: hypothetical protein M0R39_13855 [Prolixibacteraceae bacterium]|jgi:hypothetical protein|nr:hypothetical protein [Prolixibacteraceae bacterium]
MKNRLSVQVLVLVSILTASTLWTSCQKSESNYSIGDFIVTFGIVESVSKDGINSILVKLDNGDQFVALDRSLHLDELKPNQRILINFAPYQDVVNSDLSKTIYGKINFIQNILYKEILPLSKAVSDSIGHDPIIVRDSWVTGDSILTVDFKYYTQGSLHYINLADNSEGNGKDKPFIFEFRHNARGDKASYAASGYVSFKLNPYKITGQHNTLFKIRFTDYDGKLNEVPHMINY